MRREFAEGGRVEGLTPEARFDAHHKDAVAVIEEGDGAVDGSLRADREMSAGAEAADRVERPRRIGQGFDMDREDVGTEAGVVGQPAIRFGHHQMDLDRDRCRAANRLDDHLSVRQLRDEHTVHDVEVDCSGAGLLEPRDFGRQMAEVTEEEGWKDDGPTALDPGGESVGGMACGTVSGRRLHTHRSFVATGLHRWSPAVAPKMETHHRRRAVYHRPPPIPRAPAFFRAVVGVQPPSADRLAENQTAPVWPPENPPRHPSPRADR